jgi:hypothetical protein
MRKFEKRHSDTTGHERRNGNRERPTLSRARDDRTNGKNREAAGIGYVEARRSSCTAASGTRTMTRLAVMAARRVQMKAIGCQNSRETKNTTL